MFDPESVLRFAADREGLGLRTALIAIIRATGSSMRDVGTIMAVCEDGESCGSISGGCIEVAIVAEALDVLKIGSARTVTFGKGSRYIDLRLPCGGSLDLHFRPLDFGVARRMSDGLKSRQKMTLTFSCRGADCHVSVAEPGVRIEHEVIAITHVPRKRLILIGTGEVVLRLHDLARSSGFNVEVGSSDARLLAQVRDPAVPPVLLIDPNRHPEFAVDHWTAIAMFFHDHDWEPPLLSRFVDSPAFYIGAMGSHRTHANRLAALREIGVSETGMRRIISPIGVIPSMRDPETLAISVLAQVVDASRNVGHILHCPPSASQGTDLSL